MIRSILRGFQRLLESLQSAWEEIVVRRSRYSLKQVEDLHASMACPRRRCLKVLNMNLAPDECPQWSLTVDAKGKPTLAPSVWERTSCGCHFFLRHGKIVWCD